MGKGTLKRDYKIRTDLESKFNEKEARSEIYRIIDEEAEALGIEKDYIMVKFLYKNPAVKVVIRLSKDKKPIDDERLISRITEKMSSVLGVHQFEYDTVKSKGKYQKIHY